MELKKKTPLHRRQSIDASRMNGNGDR